MNRYSLHIVITCFFFWSYLHPTFAQICPGNVILDTQEELIEFAEEECTRIQGNLTISGDVSDLTPLFRLQTVTGDLVIRNADPHNLDGLQNLDSIFGRFEINDNPNLTTLFGLESLEFVGKNFLITKNDQLQSIADLIALEQVGNLSIASNSRLQQTGTFPSLLSIKSDLSISGDSIEQILGFYKLKEVNAITFNSSQLRLISGFTRLDTIKEMDIAFQGSLESISGFDSLHYVTDLIGFRSCDQLQTLPSFDELRYAGVISFFGCSRLEKIPDFVKLDSSNFLTFQFLDLVDSIPVFPNLKKLRALQVFSVIKLEHLDRFNSISNLDWVNIRQNPELKYIRVGTQTEHMSNLEVILNPELLEMHGFDSLRTVEFIEISACEALAYIPAFPSLTKVVRRLTLQELGLTEINGFLRLDSVGTVYEPPLTGLFMSWLPRLKKIIGFPALQYANTFRISAAPLLDTLKAFGQFNNIMRNMYVRGTGLQDLSAFQAMRFVDGFISINANPALTDITGLDSLNTSVLDKIYIDLNSELEMCRTHFICSALHEGIPMDIRGNKNTCNSVFEVIQACDGLYAHIYAEVFYDVDQNGILEPKEPLFPLFRLHILPDTVELLSNPVYPVTYYTDFGAYRVSASLINQENWVLTSAMDTFTVVLTEMEPGDTIRFGFYPDTLIRRLQTFQTSSYLICNQRVVLQSLVKNHGTTIEDGILWVHLDEHVLDTVLIDPPDTVSGAFLGYRYHDLFPGQTHAVEISFKVPGPDEYTIGAPMNFECFAADYNTGDTTMHYSYSQILLCGYDPNDKLTHPARPYGQTFPDEDLHYTIRFQNTGNFEVRHVILRDTLDDLLDPNTVSVLNTSHPFELTTRIRDHELIFEFRNIYLQDSFYYPEQSHGFVSFQVQPVRPVAEWAIIENRASIYFDQNPGIQTNEVRNLFAGSAIDICSADAGMDTTLCVDVINGLVSYQMGGVPVVAGGIPPWTYAWKTQTGGMSGGIKASDFLDDTTSANPVLLHPAEQDLIFYLEISDSLELTCVDTVTIRFSNWYVNSDVKECSIHPGDSCQLYTSVSGGIPPFLYEWSPMEGLADPFDLFTQASPDRSMTYELLITDAAGCQVQDSFHVFIMPTSTQWPSANSSAIHLFPNPVTSETVLIIKGRTLQNGSMIIYDSFGHWVKDYSIKDDFTRINGEFFHPGLYFYSIIDDAIPVYYGSFIKH